MKAQRYGVECQICGHHEERSLIGHLREKHQMSSPEYKLLYPGHKVMTGHSKRTLEYWIYGGHTEEEAKKRVKEVQQSHSRRYVERVREEVKREGKGEEEVRKRLSLEAKQRSSRCVEHFEAVGYSKEEATEKRRELQAKYSAKSSRFSGHRHSDIAKEKISRAVRKQILLEGPKTRVGKFYVHMEGSRSKAERECFLRLKEIFPEIQASVEVETKVVDMKLGNIVVEFYGDFWHKNPKLYEATHEWKGISSQYVWDKDKKRQTFLESAGNTVYIIWETDWNDRREEVIKELQKLHENTNKGS